MLSDKLPHYHQLFGVDKYADAATIKQRYHKLLLACYPDGIKDKASILQKRDGLENVRQDSEVPGSGVRRAEIDVQQNEETLRRQDSVKDTQSAQDLDSQSNAMNDLDISTPEWSSTPIKGNQKHHHGESRPWHFRHHPNTEKQRCSSTQKLRRCLMNMLFLSDAVGYMMTKGVEETHVTTELIYDPPSKQYKAHPVYRQMHKQSTTTTTTRNTATLKGLRGIVNSRETIALCDTGSQENFIRQSHAMDLGLNFQPFNPGQRPSFMTGNGKFMHAIGFVKTIWCFCADTDTVEVILYVLQDCIFDMLLGAKFLLGTETITKKQYRMCEMPRPRNGPSGRLVNLCGTPPWHFGGWIGIKKCYALADSGSEPNLLSYKYAKQNGWLSYMYRAPKSCRLLQFANGETARVSGRLRLPWGFVSGQQIPYNDKYYEFDVLRGCPFDIVLGCELLEDSRAFTQGIESLTTMDRNVRSGINVVFWVKSKLGRRKKKEALSSAVYELECRKLEREAELEQLAAAASAVAELQLSRKSSQR